MQRVDAIINANYDACGLNDKPWKFERDKYIHSENAVITRLNETKKAESHTFEA